MIRAFILFWCLVSLGQVDAQSRLAIVGTLHQTSPKINADTLYNLLVKLKPDIFLLEIDSLDRLNHLSPNDAKGNEIVAIVRYKQSHPDVQIVPFDMTDKVAFMRREKYWDKIGLYNKALDSLITNNRLDSLSQTVIEAFSDLTASTRYFDSGLADLRTINSKDATLAIELRNKWEYNKLRLLVNRDIHLAEINKYAILGSEYWNIRNKAMATNILAAVKKNPGKRLVAFVGNNHRYYLLKEIIPQQSVFKFILKDYWDL